MLGVSSLAELERRFASVLVIWLAVSCVYFGVLGALAGAGLITVEGVLSFHQFGFVPVRVQGQFLHFSFKRICY